VSDRLLRAARRLCATVAGLSFAPPVTHIYNPLAYAWPAHAAYLRRYGNSRRRVVFLGMNPGPFGMVQTGVPFGEVAAVRDWLGIDEPVGKPAREHPKRPVTGFACARSEISGRRLWGLFARRFVRPERFFGEHLVLNYCPLAFLENSGRNRTPDKLAGPDRRRLFAACDEHLREVMEILEPEWVVGVGGFATQRAEQVLSTGGVKIVRILHPSPASPAANRDWAGVATASLRKSGVWG
jgi:single-strand selective monofunctional uracil DNA glycosylase